MQLVDSQISSPIFLVIESGRCCDGEIYINVCSKNKTLKEAKESFIETMKVFLGCEEEDEDEEDEEYWSEDHDSFEERFKEEIDEGVFIDYSEPYILKIVEK